MRHRDQSEPVTEVPWPFSEQQRIRRRRYLVLMGVCLTLVVLAWTVVPLWSTSLAVAMSLVAAVLPPVAAIVANRGTARLTVAVVGVGAILAIDQGTSGTKAVVVGEDGAVLAAALEPVRPDYLPGDGVEVDPEELWGSVVASGRLAVERAGVPIEAVALANQGETVLAWDRTTGRAAHPGAGMAGRSRPIGHRPAGRPRRAGRGPLRVGARSLLLRAEDALDP